jgi:hypothetical protein
MPKEFPRQRHAQQKRTAVIAPGEVVQPALPGIRLPSTIHNLRLRDLLLI